MASTRALPPVGDEPHVLGHRRRHALEPQLLEVGRQAVEGLACTAALTASPYRVEQAEVGGGRLDVAGGVAEPPLAGHGLGVVRRVVGRPARHVRGHQLAADVAVHRAAGHADDAGGPADAAPGTDMGSPCALTSIVAGTLATRTTSPIASRARRLPTAAARPSPP